MSFYFCFIGAGDFSENVMVSQYNKNVTRKHFNFNRLFNELVKVEFSPVRNLRCSMVIRQLTRCCVS